MNRAPRGLASADRLDGRVLLAEELPKVKAYLGEAAYDAGKYEAGAKLFEQITVGEYVEFLTLPAYALID